MRARKDNKRATEALPDREVDHLQRELDEEAARALELEVLGEEVENVNHRNSSKTRRPDSKIDTEWDGAAQKKLKAAGPGAKKPAARRVPAWTDEADEAGVVVNIAGVNRLRKLRKNADEETVTGAEYARRLRAQHAKLNPGVAWARPKTLAAKGEAGGNAHPAHDDSGKEDDGDYNKGRDDDDDEEEAEGELAPEDVLRSAAALTGSQRSRRLPQGHIDVSRLKDANQQSPCQGVVRALRFHPRSQVMMTASLDKALAFFQVDGSKNPLIQRVFLEDMPIYDANFSASGDKVIAVGRRKHYYVFDMGSAQVERVNCLIGCDEKSLETFAASPAKDEVAFLGAGGRIMLASLNSRHLIGTLKMNGTARTLAYTPDGMELLTSGGDGQVYHWDLRTRRCLHRGVDEGCVNSTALAVAPSGKLFATGSDSGVVNIYDRKAALASATAPPLRALMNLTTSTDHLAFSPDSQILAMSSRMKADAMRLVHLPSATVFANWPSSRTPLHYVTALGFSPGGGFLGIGNARGRVLLYRVHHYNSI